MGGAGGGPNARNGLGSTDGTLGCGGGGMFVRIESQLNGGNGGNGYVKISTVVGMAPL